MKVIHLNYLKTLLLIKFLLCDIEINNLILEKYLCLSNKNTSNVIVLSAV